MSRWLSIIKEKEMKNILLAIIILLLSNGFVTARDMFTNNHPKKFNYKTYNYFRSDGSTYVLKVPNRIWKEIVKTKNENFRNFLTKNLNTRINKRTVYRRFNGTYYESSDLINWNLINMSDYSFNSNSNLSNNFQNNLTSNISYIINPNPVLDILNIQLNNNLTFNKIKILRPDGYIALETKFTPSIDISALQKGLYFLFIGDQVTKFIKM